MYARGQIFNVDSKIDRFRCLALKYMTIEISECIGALQARFYLYISIISESMQCPLSSISTLTKPKVIPRPIHLPNIRIPYSASIIDVPRQAAFRASSSYIP